MPVHHLGLVRKGAFRVNLFVYTRLVTVQADIEPNYGVVSVHTTKGIPKGSTRRFRDVDGNQPQRRRAGSGFPFAEKIEHHHLSIK